MTGDVTAEVWMAGGYAVFLLLVAFGLDLVARRTATRSGGWRSGAFRYHEDHDAWVCPEDQWLWPQSFDPDNRVMRYRASPSVCNACPVKDTCTTSEHGREITRNVDPWPSSEAERFHRAIACTVAVLAVLWPLVTMAGERTGIELAVLGGAALLVAIGSWPLWSHLRRSPAGFPEHVQVESLDETVAAASAAAEARARRRTTYASDRLAREDGADRPAGWSRLGGAS
ncbi:MAG TPA: hypothetical protein VFZ64_00685 [Nocardioidaceae bacterium]